MEIHPQNLESRKTRDNFHLCINVRKLQDHLGFGNILHHFRFWNILHNLGF